MRVDHHRAVEPEQQRVAVGRRLRDELRADVAARAGAVVDDDLLPEALASGSATTRALLSATPPGENGTTMRTGLIG